MKLTIKQVQRLCGIEQTMCASWLSEAKAMKHFLRSGSDRSPHRRANRVAENVERARRARSAMGLTQSATGEPSPMVSMP